MKDARLVTDDWYFVRMSCWRLLAYHLRKTYGGGHLHHLAGVPGWWTKPPSTAGAGP